MPAEHGTRKEYQRGCRCEPCKDANNDYARAWQEKHRPAVTEFFSNFIDEGDMSWLEYSACKNEDTETFFPTRGENAKVEKAKRICSTCQVQTDCLQYALRTEQEVGIWGGRSSRELRVMQSMIARERRKATAA